MLLPNIWELLQQRTEPVLTPATLCLGLSASDTDAGGTLSHLDDMWRLSNNSVDSFQSTESAQCQKKAVTGCKQEPNFQNSCYMLKLSRSYMDIQWFTLVIRGRDEASLSDMVAASGGMRVFWKLIIAQDVKESKRGCGKLQKRPSASSWKWVIKLNNSTPV